MAAAGKIFPMEQQSRLAQLLRRYGASPDRKDFLGKTVVHYGAGAMATPMTMDIADMCIKAAETLEMFEKDAVLEGLQSSNDMNGKRNRRWIRCSD